MLFLRGVIYTAIWAQKEADPLSQDSASILTSDCTLRICGNACSVFRPRGIPQPREVRTLRFLRIRKAHRIYGSSVPYNPEPSDCTDNALEASSVPLPLSDTDREVLGFPVNRFYSASRCPPSTVLSSSIRITRRPHSVQCCGILAPNHPWCPQLVHSSRIKGPFPLFTSLRTVPFSSSQ